MLLPGTPTTNTNSPSLLTGLIYDETGDRLCPTHANKKGRRYRYYISKRLMHKTGSTTGGWRLPATELEAVIQQVIQEFLGDKLRIVETLHLDGKSPDRLRTIVGEFAAAADEIRNGSAERRGSLLFAVVHRIELGAEFALHRVQAKQSFGITVRPANRWNRSMGRDIQRRHARSAEIGGASRRSS